MGELIAGVNAKLGTEEVNKIIEIAKEYLEKNPNSKELLLHLVSYKLMTLG